MYNNITFPAIDHSACVWLVQRTETHSPVKKASRQLYRVQWAIWTSGRSDRPNIWAGHRVPTFFTKVDSVWLVLHTLLNTGYTPC